MKIKMTVKGIDSLYSFFAEGEQMPYQTPYNLIAQFSKDTCVAACARMILADFGVDAPESYLASDLETDGGAYLSRVPQTLKTFGLNVNFEWRKNLTITELSKFLKHGRAIVFLHRKNEKFGRFRNRG